MKKLIVFTLILITFSCSKENNKPSGAELNGKWNVVAYDPGLTPEAPPVLKKGDVVWTFDSLSNEIKVENNVGNKYLSASGSYSISIKSNSINIHSTEYEYSFYNGKLLLAQIPRGCGGLIEFARD